MKNRWCRLYAELLDDPKISRLDHETFHFFINLLCIATEESKFGLIDMNEEQLAWRMRFSKKATVRSIKILKNLNILENFPEISENGHKTVRLKNWCKRQFVSDDISKRVADWRGKNKPQTTANETLHETLPLCNTDTDTDTDNKTFSVSGETERLKTVEEWTSKKKRKLSGKRLESFKRFWRAFDYPKDRASAIDAWINIPELTNSMVDKIVESASKTAAERPQLLADRRTPQYAQGWITARRWEDEAPRVSQYPQHGPTYKELSIK